MELKKLIVPVTAILAIVLGIIIILQLIPCCVPQPYNSDPNYRASLGVKSQLNVSDFYFLIMDDIAFNPGDTLINRTIAEQSGSLSAEQVCILISSDVPNYETDFQSYESTVIKYVGLAQKTRLLVVCDQFRDLEESFSNHQSNYKFSLDVSSCKAPSDETLKYCLVAIIPDK